MRHDVFSYRLLSQLVIQESQTFGCIVKFPFCLLKQNICLILYPIKKLSPISQYVLYYYYYDKICAASTHSVRLTGSLAASWQRCTRLSKVDLRTMCSAGISFCSTRSAGSCWRSWKKNKDATTSVDGSALLLSIWKRHTQTCTLGSCGAPGGTWAWSWGWGASTGNPITGAVMGAGGV